MGKHLLSHRYNLLPLLRSRPGGVQRELIVKDLPTANVAKDINPQKDILLLFAFPSLIGAKGLRTKAIIFLKKCATYMNLRLSKCKYYTSIHPKLKKKA